MNRKGLIATFALTTLLVGSLSHAQAPAGYELALVDVDGTKTVVGQLPPNVYAPRHQLQILERSRRPRLRLTAADRLSLLELRSRCAY